MVASIRSIAIGIPGSKAKYSLLMITPLLGQTKTAPKPERGINQDICHKQISFVKKRVGKP